MQSWNLLKLGHWLLLMNHLLGLVLLLLDNWSVSFLQWPETIENRMDEFFGLRINTVLLFEIATRKRGFLHLKDFSFLIHQAFKSVFHLVFSAVPHLFGNI